MYCFQVYIGVVGNGKSAGLGYRVVMDLMENYRMKRHSLFINNFYTSPRLLRDLLTVQELLELTGKNFLKK